MSSPRSVRLRVSLELVDEHGAVVIAAPSDTFVQGSRLGELEAQIGRGQVMPMDADNNMVAQVAFQLSRDSYKRLATALMSRGEAA